MPIEEDTTEEDTWAAEKACRANKAVALCEELASLDPDKFTNPVLIGAITVAKEVMAS